MTANEFVYWLQGFAELNAEPPTAEQWASIREHLGLAFKKVTGPVNLPPNQSAGPINVGSAFRDQGQCLPSRAIC